MNEIFKLFGTVAINGVDEAEREIEGLTSTAQKSESKLISGFKKIGAAVAAAFAVDKIISFGQEIVNAAATVAAEESAFAQIMGDYADEAAEKMSGLADSVGMVDTRLTPYMTSMTAKFKGLGYGIEEATGYATRGLGLAADASAFWDMSLDESVSHLNSFINGSYEGGEAIGLFANDTQMAMYAVEQGIVSSKTKWKDLDEATKQATRLEYAENMMKLSGATGQASKEAGQYANSSANLAEKWRQLKAELGEPILQNVVVPAMQALYDVLTVATDKVKDLKKWVSENKETINIWSGVIVGATATVGTFLLILNWGQIMSAAAAALGYVTTAFAKLNAVIAANPIGFVVSLITGLISTLVYLYQTNETFAAFVDGILAVIWEKLKQFFAWLQENVLPVIQSIIGWLQENALPVIQGIIAWLQENVMPVIQQLIGWLTETVGGFFAWLLETFGSTGESVGGIWETIKGYFQTAWDFIVGIWQACLPFFEGIWNGIILPVWGLVQEIWGAFQMAWDVIQLVWGYVQPYFAGVWDGIQAVFSVVGEILGMYFQNAWEIIKLVWSVAAGYFGVIWEAIKGVFSVVSAVLGGFFRTAWEVIKAVWSIAISFFTMVWAGIKAVFAVVKGVLSGDFSDAWAAIKNLWDKAKNYFSTVWTGIKNVFSAVGSWFGNTFKAAWNAVKNVFSSWGSFFSGLWDKITNTFSKIGSNIANAISGSVKSGINGVISMIEGTINTGINIINGAIRLANLIPGVDVDSVNHVSLPRLAKGGIVDRPTIAEIGEDGAEAVVPLERNTKWLDLVANKVAENSANGVIADVLEILEYFLPLILEKCGGDLVADDGAILARYAPLFDSELGKIRSRKERGR